MASFRCYDNSDVIATLIMTIFHLCLMQLWWQFFQMFVRYWPWKTVSRHSHMPVRPILLHRMGLISFRLFCKNLGYLQEFFGQMVYRPPLAENCPYAYDLNPGVTIFHGRRGRVSFRCSINKSAVVWQNGRYFRLNDQASCRDASGRLLDLIFLWIRPPSFKRRSTWRTKITNAIPRKVSEMMSFKWDSKRA